MIDKPTHKALFAGHELACIRGERLVFSNLNFELDAGECLRVTGPNGAGKSSFLRLLAGLLQPASGGLFWAGADTRSDRDGQRGRTLYIGHQNPIKPWMTPREMLDFWSTLGEPKITDANTKADQSARPSDSPLAPLGLEKLADVPGKFLSAGQKRRLNLSRALVVSARIWLLDEPTVGLDTASIAAFEKLLSDHCDNGGVAVVATHTPIALPAVRELQIGEAQRPR